MTDESFEEIFCFHPIEKMFLNFIFKVLRRF
jgi:hypothetical protein